MRQGKRFGLSAIEKSDIWRRWKAGETLHEIGRAFDKPHTSIRCLLLPRGGIPPAVRRRSRLALRRSTQHLPKVYLREFGILRSFSVVDSSKPSRNILSLCQIERKARATTGCGRNAFARQQQTPNRAVRLVKGAPDLVQRLSGLPATPDLALLNRRKTKPFP